MLEFILFLSTEEEEILSLIYKAKFVAEENTPLCLLGKKFIGFLKPSQRTIVICTKNAKELGRRNNSTIFDDENNKSFTSIYIRRALRHEAVHVAQHCNNGKLLGLSKIKTLSLNPNKKKAIYRSSKFTGKTAKEYEAYLIEDNPSLVKAYLRKYCL